MQPVAAQQARLRGDLLPVEQYHVGLFLCFKQKTAYESLRSDWSPDVCSSDLAPSELQSLRRISYAVFCLRSEEHTSELQSLRRISYAVFCLKTKKNTTELKSLQS